MENFLQIINFFSIIDIIFLSFLIINSFVSLNSGFVLSLLSFLKWILAIILTNIILPITSQFTETIIKSGFTHDIVFGSVIFVLSIFFIILISKGLKKTVNWTGFGNVDKFFGLIFGVFKGYFYFISIFTLINFIHPYDKWNNNFNEGRLFNVIVNGNKFLEENLPKRYEYINKSKENVEKITK